MESQACCRDCYLSSAEEGDHTLGCSCAGPVEALVVVVCSGMRFVVEVGLDMRVALSVDSGMTVAVEVGSDMTVEVEVDSYKAAGSMKPRDEGG